MSDEGGYHRLLACLLLAGVVGACRSQPYPDCEPEIVLTPTAVQGQPYQLHVGDVAVLELVQVPVFCGVALVTSARWDSSHPEVATIGPFEGQPRFGGQFPVQLTAMQAGRTTIRVSYRQRGREAEARQEVFVLAPPPREQ